MLEIFGGNIDIDSVKSIEEIGTVADELVNFVNNNVIFKFCELHNIDPKNSIIKIKREKISTICFFPNVKKKYCMRVVNEEGVNVNKIDVVGFAIRRSDYPAVTKEKLMELIDLILSEDKTKEDIKEFIISVSNYIYNLAVCGKREVGKPVTYSRGEYKVVPAHVLGMQLWNKLEYECFFQGSKGYMFRIKDINTNDPEFKKKNIDLSLINLRQYNYIVMPIDYEQLPKYYIVDAHKVLKYAWIDVVSSFDFKFI